MISTRQATRKINFGPGPAALPQEVLQQASEAVVDYNSKGLSILELPHRSKDFDNILEECKQLVKELCNLDNDYHVLWLHGGGRLQFCMVPMNFLTERNSAGYIDSGHWATEAMEYAMHYGNVQVLSTSREGNYTHLPEWPSDISKDLSYIHFTTNNTIYGTQWQDVPIVPVPLIADMSSDIFCRERDYSSYQLFYAAAQKNIGPAGVTLVVVHKDMLGRIVRSLPPMLNYKAQVESNSVLNTSPVFAIYTSLLMLRWTKATGIKSISADNKHKAWLLYNEIERNSLFIPVVDRKGDRSIMNACFTGRTKQEEQSFINFCNLKDITGIDGHRSVGGFRVSLYNAVTVQDVEVLISAMKEFETQFSNIKK